MDEDVAVVRWAAELELLKRDQKIAQYKKAYYRLPVVPKVLFIGPRGGVFYVNQRNKKVYLGREGNWRLANDKLAGLVDVVDADPQPLFDVRRQLNRLRNARR